MTGVLLRLALAALCLFGAVRLLGLAHRARTAWAVREAGISRAEKWWSRHHGGPFDQDGGEVPKDVQPYLGAKGPRVDLRSQRPATAPFVWGWILLVVSAFLAISAVAQLSSGTF